MKATFAVTAVMLPLDLPKLDRIHHQGHESQTHIQILDQLLGSVNWLSTHENGPLWFRGYSRWSDTEGEDFLAPLIQLLGVKRIVVGHTVQANGEISRRFGGKAFLIDTGMVAGRPSALEISGDHIRALYLNKQTDFN